MSTVDDPLAQGGPMPAAPEPATTAADARRRKAFRAMAYGAVIFAALAIIADLTDSTGLTAAGTSGAALRLALPIGLAGLGGLWAERSGVVNIGLEGMMIFGTWFGAWGGIEFGPWWGIVFGILGGAAGGLLHAIATVGFGVDHIVSGVAINLLGAGVARYLNVVVYEGTPGAGATQSPRVEGRIGNFDMPFLAGGDLFGWRSPDLLRWLARQDWFLLSDAGSFLRGLTGGVPYAVLFGISLFPLSWWILWRTPFGLRLRSCGEDPWAAESLGVNVYRMKTIAVTVSGALAGLGGALLVLVFANIYREGQTAGRGFIGLAAMIFGNWTPGGLAAGAGLFGFVDALQLRDPSSVHALLLFVAVLLAGFAVRALLAGRVVNAVASLAAAGAFVLWWVLTDEYPVQFITFTPHIITLLVLAFASQRLRMPAADGIRYRRGEGH
jgi:general nucleoside transport system permease protein